MANTDRDDPTALAGEYVLGTLDGAERRTVEARLESDDVLRRAVADWESRLQPLAETITPETPPPYLLERIMTATGHTETSPVDVTVLERSVRRWRISSAVLAGLTLGLIGVIAADRVLQPQRLAGEYVAVLAADDVQSGFVVTIDLTNERLTIRRVADPAPEAHAYELWEIEPGQNPRSLGLIDAAYEDVVIERVPSEDAVLAVSLEPTGGSPTGQPTGPVVFSGSVTRVN